MTFRISSPWPRTSHQRRWFHESLQWYRRCCQHWNAALMRLAIDLVNLWPLSVSEVARLPLSSYAAADTAQMTRRVPAKIQFPETIPVFWDRPVCWRLIEVMKLMFVLISDFRLGFSFQLGWQSTHLFCRRKYCLISSFDGVPIKNWVLSILDKLPDISLFIFSIFN